MIPAPVCKPVMLFLCSSKISQYICDADPQSPKWEKVDGEEKTVDTFTPAPRSFYLHLITLSPYQQFPVATATSRVLNYSRCICCSILIPEDSKENYHKGNYKITIVRLLGIVVKKKETQTFLSEGHPPLWQNPESRSTHCLTGLLLLTKDVYALTRVGCW